MSIITLQFGQCGNQIGQTLYEFIYDDIKRCKRVPKYLNVDYITDSTNKWFSIVKEKLEAKSISIDTENKVTDLANRKKEYQFKNIISSAFGGSANNWAYGYTSRSELVIEHIVEKVRKEIEKCDFLSCMLNILSSSGGTGSGVGSRTIEILREEYPSKFIVNAVILPYKNGDVVTQNYNTLLTLTKLYDITDCTILFENDKSHQICNKLIGNKEIKLHDLNCLIAQQLASVTQPVKDLTFSKIVSHISSHPSYKFVQINSAPNVSKENMKYEPLPNWSVLINNVMKGSKSDILLKPMLCKRIMNIGSVLITRGVTAPTENEIKRLSDSSLFTSWVPESDRLGYYCQQRSFMDYEKYLSLISNNNNVCHSLNFILEDSWNLFTHGAYIHHYKKFGVNDEYFLEAFQKLENVLNDYKLL